MANPEHLKILKQGVEVWNRWKEKRSDVMLDFRSADLKGQTYWNVVLWGGSSNATV